jgi:hypothetical protein
MVEAQSAALYGELVGCGRRTVTDYLEQWLAAVQASMEPAGCTNYRTSLTLYVCRASVTCCWPPSRR